MSEQYPDGSPEQPDGGPTPPPPPPGQAGRQPYGQQPPYGQQSWQQPYGQQPPYYAPQAPGYSQAGQPADLGVRFVARLIDWVLIAILNGVIGFFIGVAAWENIMTTGEVSYGSVALGAIIGAAVSLAYFTLMEANLEQTLGKMLVKVRTVGPGGGRPTTAEALKRNAWTALGILGVVPMLGWLGSLLYLAAVIAIAVTISSNTATRQGWHDNFAGGTRVVRTG